MKLHSVGQKTLLDRSPRGLDLDLPVIEVLEESPPLMPCGTTGPDVCAHEGRRGVDGGTGVGGGAAFVSTRPAGRARLLMAFVPRNKMFL